MSAKGLDENIWTKVFERPKKIVSRKIAGELFLVPIAGKLADMQKMFALTEVAQFIWEKIDGECSLGDIRDKVFAQFDAEKGQLDSDVREFVANLIDEELIIEVAG